MQQLDSGAFSNLKSAWCEDMRIFTQLQLVVRVDKIEQLINRLE